MKKTSKPKKPTQKDTTKEVESTKKPAKKPSKRRGKVKKAASAQPSRKKRTAKKEKVAVTGEQLKLVQKRLEAGRKAAITRKANSARRGPGRPSKAESRAKLVGSQEREFMETVVNVGIDRSEGLLRKIRDVANEV